ncbi:unnamed protein product (macronuclear) [Paramecium tetraurelia]|uniref:Transmembrane protein n=1 Tax=Paramecium tetraurelia TaxID=5888 RepID=A0DCC1_PARTE|nr:uncharacterized protein GSPATT00015566001 [Paramecium tetraurelia]CAK80688.1 unnamed protein product [Paramecium tetraurelia]|eukprot:XP_001448085.1 hypothetical protein (macronuclear) [Paramecium tetraurelia strain d4-2]
MSYQNHPQKFPFDSQGPQGQPQVPLFQQVYFAQQQQIYGFEQQQFPSLNYNGYGYYLFVSSVPQYNIPPQQPTPVDSLSSNSISLSDQGAKKKKKNKSDKSKKDKKKKRKRGLIYPYYQKPVVVVLLLVVVILVVAVARAVVKKRKNLYPFYIMRIIGSASIVIISISLIVQSVIDVRKVENRLQKTTKARSMFQTQTIGNVTFVEILITQEEINAIDVKKINQKPQCLNNPHNIIKQTEVFSFAFHISKHNCISHSALSFYPFNLQLKFTIISDIPLKYTISPFNIFQYTTWMITDSNDSFYKNQKIPKQINILKLLRDQLFQINLSPYYTVHQTQKGFTKRTQLIQQF